MRFLLLATFLFLAGCVSQSPSGLESVRVQATDMSTGESVPVAASVLNGYVLMVHLPMGGEATFGGECFVDTDFNGECVDEDGNTWIFEGAAE